MFLQNIERVIERFDLGIVNRRLVDELFADIRFDDRSTSEPAPFIRVELIQQEDIFDFNTDTVAFARIIDCFGNRRKWDFAHGIGPLNNEAFMVRSFGAVDAEMCTNPRFAVNAIPGNII